MELSIVDLFEMIRTNEREKRENTNGESCCEEEGCCEEAGEEGCQEGLEAPLKSSTDDAVPSFAARLGTA